MKDYVDGENMVNTETCLANKFRLGKLKGHSTPSPLFTASLFVLFPTNKV